MAQHNSLLRSVVRNFHGYEVSSEGQAFLIAFASPIDALAFATEVQKSLLKSEWPEELHAFRSAQPEKHPAPCSCFRSLPDRSFSVLTCHLNISPGRLLAL